MSNWDKTGARRYGTKRFRYDVKKNNEAGNSLNAVEREPVPTTVLNPNASEASYKLKQRSYRTFCTENVLYRNVAKRYPSDPALAESCTSATAGV